jgi:hypothetical protein
LLHFIVRCKGFPLELIYSSLEEEQNSFLLFLLTLYLLYLLLI